MGKIDQYLCAPPIDGENGSSALKGQFSVLEVMLRQIKLKTQDRSERAVVLLAKVVTTQVA